jgi:CRP/FNR family cyclic AMP-dependent transcriptional regulator
MAKVMISNVLSGLPRQLVTKLFADATPHRLEPGAALFRAGDPGTGCYRIDAGLLKVVVSSSQGEERIIAILGPEAIVGELSMIDGLPRSASVVAISSCELAFVSRKSFEQYTEAHPEICQYLMRTLATRLREADEALAAATFLTVKGRVARALLDLAEYVGQEGGHGEILLRHRFSQSDLAAMAGVARENVSRTLSEWRRRELVTQSANYYCINDAKALAREMEFES